MGTTADKLNAIKATKAAIKQAITEKGGTPNDVFSTYPDLIRAIQSGGIEPGVLVTGADATLQFQPLSFNGTTPSDNGSPVALSELGIYNTGKNEPDFTPAPIPPTPLPYDKKYTVVKAVTGVGTESIRFVRITPASATIDWGDGVTNSELMHTYSKAGEHIIKITNATGIEFGYNPAIGEPQNYGSITEAIQCGDTIQDCGSMFSFCTGLWLLHNTFRIPAGTKSCMDMFRNCEQLEHLPEFSLPSGILRCDMMFRDCKHLRTIPDTLRIPNGVRDCSYMFSSCTNLEYIPDTFRIPNELKDCNRMFSNCTNLRLIPDTFRIPIKSSDFSGIFYECPELYHDIAKLFNSKPFSEQNVQCSSAFYNCGKLYGVAPSLWNDAEKFSNHLNTFNTCTGLANYDQIPADWK